MVAHEEQPRLGVVHDVVDLLGIELVEDGHGDGAEGEGSEEGYGPLAGVAPAEGYLVALLYTAVLEEDMYFLNLSGYIMILQRLALVVCQRITIPIVDDALLDQ